MYTAQTRSEPSLAEDLGVCPGVDDSHPSRTLSADTVWRGSLTYCRITAMRRVDILIGHEGGLSAMPC